MKSTANIVTLIVVLLSLLNVGEYNNISIDVITTLLMLVTSCLFIANWRHTTIIICSMIVTIYCWKQQQYIILSNFADILVTLTFFLCVPSNASLLLCMKSVINVLLRAINPSLYILAEIVDICICLYLFYDTRAVLSTYFPKLRSDDGHRKTGV